MADRRDEVQGTKVAVSFEAKRCIHSRNCVLGRPDVFVPNAPGPWLHPDAASVETVTALVETCPSGALTFKRLDGGPEEQAPPVNVVRVRENGPLAFHADLHVEGSEGRLRATLCRCGASKSKPFCDNSHSRVGFHATGEPESQDSPALAQRDGPLSVTPLPDGPLFVSGNVEIVSGTGRMVVRSRKVALCRCGGSANKPFCDGTHAQNGFQTEVT
jgi:CDGSH-type Zn-finger protein/uncharacterized Fe-S cluster protein YjdI